MTEESIPLIAMVNNSSLMYSFASLRSVVLEHSEDFGDLNNGLEKVKFESPNLIITEKDEFDVHNRPNAYLKSSVSAANLLLFLQLNRHLYTEELTFNDNHSGKIAGGIDPLFCEDEMQTMAEKYDAEFWEFDDKFSDSELVYGVIVNRKEKRIIVAFRGTVTMKDILVDLNGLSAIPDEYNFAHKLNLVPKGTKIKIHRGFNKYLFENKKDKSGTKFEDIVRDLQDVYAYKDDHNDYSDYRLFITGHSLGGALASLTAVALAGCEVANSIPGIFPAIAITFASPRVANRGFQNLHRRLEESNKIRHIRVTNNGDIIPTMPFFFGHAGVQVKLYKTGIVDVHYESDNSCCSQMGYSSLLMHSIDTYEKHLLIEDVDESKSDLSIPKVLKKSVDDMYLEYGNAK